MNTHVSIGETADESRLDLGSFCTFMYVDTLRTLFFGALDSNMHKATCCITWYKVKKSFLRFYAFFSNPWKLADKARIIHFLTLNAPRWRHQKYRILQGRDICHAYPNFRHFTSKLYSMNQNWMLFALNPPDVSVVLFQQFRSIDADLRSKRIIPPNTSQSAILTFSGKNPTQLLFYYLTKIREA